jgi:hypothetical protein
MILEDSVASVGSIRQPIGRDIHGLSVWKSSDEPWAGFAPGFAWHFNTTLRSPIKEPSRRKVNELGGQIAFRQNDPWLAGEQPDARGIAIKKLAPLGAPVRTNDLDTVFGHALSSSCPTR